MRLRTRSLAFILTLALALGATLASASPQWAVTASLGKIFLVKFDQDTVSSYLSAELNGSTLTGIATWRNEGTTYIFVADSATQGDTAPPHLRVGKINDSLTGSTINPTIEWIGDPIALAPPPGGDLLKQPGAVAVDASGGVYVLGGRWNDDSNVKHSNYAYVTSSNGAWTDANVLIVNRPTTTLADIAPAGSGMVIAHRDTTSSWAFQSCMTAVAGTSIGGSLIPPGDGDGGYIPRGIAAGTGPLSNFSYIANQSTEVASPAGPVNVGSISIVSNNPLGYALASAFQLGEFRPTDIAFLTSNGVNFLGLVGVTSTGSQAWRIELDPTTGLPIEDGIIAKRDLDNSTDHFCTASQDGSLFWATSPQANTVAAFDTENWTIIPSVSVDGSAGYIAAYLVPEPSSLLSLLVGGTGILALRARRRRH